MLGKKGPGDFARSPVLRGVLAAGLIVVRTAKWDR
jgi:hypothetical protein